MKKSLKYLLIIVLLVFMYLGYTFYPALNIVTGYASKNMASGLFLAKRDQLTMEKQDNGFLPINFANYVIDEEGKSVSSSIFGMMKRKAIYVEGLGAILVNDEYDPTKKFEIPSRFRSENNLAYPYGDLPQRDTIFAEVNYDKRNTTKASKTLCWRS